MAKRLKKEVIQKVKASNKLFGEVADIMGIYQTSLSSSIDRNGLSLNRYEVVKHIADSLGVNPDSIVEEVEESVSA